MIKSMVSITLAVTMMTTIVTASSPDPRGCHLKMICAASRRGVAMEMLEPLRGLRELKRAFLLGNFPFAAAKSDTLILISPSQLHQPLALPWRPSVLTRTKSLYRSSPPSPRPTPSIRVFPDPKEERPSINSMLMRHMIKRLGLKRSSPNQQKDGD